MSTEWKNFLSTEKRSFITFQYQLEHHLFPLMPRHNLPAVQPAVRDICRRNGLRYDSVPFFQALRRLWLDNVDSVVDEVWAGSLLLA